MITKRIVILANSRKNAERCLAGVEVPFTPINSWVRPISIRLGHGLNEMERLYQNKNEPEVLDVVDITLIRAQPHSCQSENWLISSRQIWKKIYSISWSQAASIAETPAALWSNGHSTYSGKNDEVPTNLVADFKKSLFLIHAISVVIHVFKDYTGNKKIHASFLYCGFNYRFSVTDVIYEQQYKQKEFGNFQLGECLLTISLGEPFTKKNGIVCHYKLIAAIIEKYRR